jgi:hypothetical protein
VSCAPATARRRASLTHLLAYTETAQPSAPSAEVPQAASLAPSVPMDTLETSAAVTSAAPSAPLQDSTPEDTGAAQAAGPASTALTAAGPRTPTLEEVDALPLSGLPLAAQDSMLSVTSEGCAAG